MDEGLRGLGIMQYPYTISYIIRRRLQIDSFMEMPKDKRPPRSIWDKPSEIEEWFERVFSNDKQTEFSIPIDEDYFED